MPRRAANRRERIATFLQSPLFLLVLGSVIFGGVAKLYSDRQVAAAERVTRRSELSKLLVEYEYRVSQLMFADGRLDPFLGDGPGITRKTKATDAERKKFEPVAVEVGKSEIAILRGTPPYVPSDPVYANVSLLAIAARLEDTAGIPDLQIGSFRQLGMLDVEPDIVWLFVRAQLSELMMFGTTRHRLLVRGDLPFPTEHELTDAEERALGWPDFKPGEAARVAAETEKALNETIDALKGS